MPFVPIVLSGSRTDVDVKSIGVMATLPDDMSPLQLGSGGYLGAVLHPHRAAEDRLARRAVERMAPSDGGWPARLDRRGARVLFHGCELERPLPQDVTQDLRYCCRC